MIFPDVTLNGVSAFQMGWLRETVSFPTPQPQTNTIVVPGRNSPIRFTEALGRVSYQPRSFEITMTMLGTRARFDEMVSELANRFVGQLVKVVRSEDTSVYAIGTLEITPEYDPLTGRGQAVLSCSDADAYLYHVSETIVEQSGTGTITLTNDYMPVVPVVTVTAETTLRWSVDKDTFDKTISAGTWEIPELELQSGENRITVSSTGITTFRYREGRL